MRDTIIVVCINPESGECVAFDQYDIDRRVYAYSENDAIAGYFRKYHGDNVKVLNPSAKEADPKEKAAA